jgi:hypothetical protein
LIESSSIEPLTGRWETSKLASMKVTLDLPDRLVREIKLRAVNDGRRLKDAAADLLEKGLCAGRPVRGARPRRVKLPIVACRHAAELTPDQVAAALFEQETQWHRDSSRH